MIFKIFQFYDKGGVRKWEEFPGTTTKNIKFEHIYDKDFQSEFKTKRYHGSYRALNMACF